MTYALPYTGIGLLYPLALAIGLGLVTAGAWIKKAASKRRDEGE